MKIKYILPIALGLIIYACSPKMTSSGSSSSTTTTATTTTVATPVEEGKSIYENNCAKCHKLFAPTDRTLEEWGPILAKMQPKAHLDDAQMALIHEYIKSEIK